MLSQSELLVNIKSEKSTELAPLHSLNSLKHGDLLRYSGTAAWASKLIGTNLQHCMEIGAVWAVQFSNFFMKIASCDITQYVCFSVVCLHLDFSFQVAYYHISSSISFLKNSALSKNSATTRSDELLGLSY